MNPAAVAVLLGITAVFLALVLYAVGSGHVWILAVLAILLVAGFVRWG